ncbi:insulinase family protein [Nocardioides sp. GY 10127]|uniref:insulinase family protein n=1 Tax=Nocardioides sp. GY 10127 TaxID=2569762 RepID=UPI0010A8E0E1|nr:insulinase family protein [Nocardioides sp. GY 10127]TIC80766.1 insulinase family protein [Nocardioides sp. GY 10127]
MDELMHRTEVDGVPTFWCESGHPTLTARLVFRQGTADGTLATSGWLHALEHLALEAVDGGSGTLSLNGSVGLLETGFDSHGPSEEVADHLARLTSWMADPVLDRWGVERGVLHAEERARGASPAAHALTWRYGALGPGLAGWPAAGIGAAEPEDLRDLAARVLTRQNAALVLDGPPPAGLRLHLPDGDLLPLPVAVPCEQTLPAGYVEPRGLVLSGEVDREGPLWLAHTILARRLTQRLRGDHGASYSPWSDYQPVDATRAVVLAGADVSPSRLPRLAEDALAVVAGLGPGGDAHALSAELDAAVAAFLQASEDPRSLPGLCAGQATRHLQGREPEGVGSLRRRARSLTAEDVTAAAESLRASLLLGVPGETAWNHATLPILQMPRVTVDGAEGRAVVRLRHADWPADPARLEVRPSGVRVVSGDQAAEALLADLAGCLTHPDGLRTLVREDGYTLVLEPTAWVGGERLPALLDPLVPPGLLLPQPSREVLPEARRTEAHLRWGRWVGRWAGQRTSTTAGRWATRAVVLALVAWLALGPVGGWVADHPGRVVGPVLALLGAAAVAAWLDRRSAAGPPRRRG